jgi:hypothetical protein
MSRLAHAFFPRFYRLLRLLEPLIGVVWRRVGIGNVVLLEVAGRRSGRPRRVYLGLLRVADRAYLGHPDLACGWTRDLEAAGGGTLRFRDGRLEAFRATLLEPGAERDAVISATVRQHPPPGSAFYWLARRHIRAVGRFYRLDPPTERQGPAHRGRMGGFLTTRAGRTACPARVADRPPGAEGHAQRSCMSIVRAPRRGKGGAAR